MREICDVELDLTVEPRDLFVEILRAFQVKGVEGAEHIRIQQRHAILHLRFDMVHALPLFDPEPEAPYRITPEFLEYSFDGGTIVVLFAVAANRDAAVLEEEAVP